MSLPLSAIAEDLAPRGPLRVSINLGNPVLAQGTPENPSGVTIDLAREIAARLNVPLHLHCYDAARKSFDAVVDGQSDLGFFAIEPARESDIAFTAPYAVIEGVFAVPDDSPIRQVAEVDREGVRIGVKEGSAYDLFLTRTMSHAEVVRGDEGVEAFAEHGLEVAAGIRQPLSEYVARHPDLRLIDQHFMQIRQAVGIPLNRQPQSLDWLWSLIESLKAGGFVSDSLRNSGQSGVATAPTLPPPVQTFEALAGRMTNLPGVSRNAKGSLVTNDGGVRAITSRGAIVVRLDPEQALQLVGAGEGQHYKGQRNAWLQLTRTMPTERVQSLIELSLS